MNPYQRPVMMPTNPAPQGPQLQWQPMPQQEQPDMSGLGGGLDALMKRFKKPNVPGAVDAPMPDFMGGGAGGAFA